MFFDILLSVLTKWGSFTVWFWHNNFCELVLTGGGGKLRWCIEIYYTVYVGFLKVVFVDFYIYFFASLVFFFAVLVITSVNLVYSVLALIVVFLLSTVVFVYLGVDFIAFLVIIVYVGAIAVLFLFVIMIVNFYRVDHNFVFTDVCIVLAIISFIFTIGVYFFPLFVGYGVSYLFGVFIFDLTYLVLYVFNGVEDYFLDFEDHSILVFDWVFWLCSVDFKFLNFNVLQDLGFFLFSYCAVVLVWVGVVLFIGTVGVLYILCFFFESDRQRQDLTDQLLRLGRLDLVYYR